jgi:hypothetical protein
MATPSDLYSSLLAALTSARSAMLNPAWQAELDKADSAVRVSAGQAAIDLQGAILTLSNESLGDIAAQMQANEAALTSATQGLTQALKDITKVQSILSSVTKAIDVLSKIVTLL